MGSGPRITVIANPTAGRGKAGRLIPEVRARLDERRADWVLRVSGGPNEPERLAREAVAGGSDIVVALGGDGLVGMLANATIGTRTALGIIPAGNGNDFSRSLGLSRKRPLDALALLEDPVVIAVDAVRVTSATVERHFVNIAGAGFDSEVTETANAMHSRLTGTARYVAALVKTLRRFTPARFEVTVDGTVYPLAAMMVAIGNGRSYGGGMRVCPDAVLGDGLLEVCVVGAMGRARFVGNFPRVFRGTHVNHPKVTMLQGRRIELAADLDTYVYADGERVGPLPASLEVLPGALRVVSP